MAAPLSRGWLQICSPLHDGRRAMHESCSIHLLIAFHSLYYGFMVKSSPPAADGGRRAAGQPGTETRWLNRSLARRTKPSTCGYSRHTLSAIAIKPQVFPSRLNRQPPAAVHQPEAARAAALRPARDCLNPREEADMAAFDRTQRHRRLDEVLDSSARATTWSGISSLDVKVPPHCRRLCRPPAADGRNVIYLRFASHRHHRLRHTWR